MLYKMQKDGDANLENPASLKDLMPFFYFCVLFVMFCENPRYISTTLLCSRFPTLGEDERTN